MKLNIKVLIFVLICSICINIAQFVSYTENKNSTQFSDLKFTNDFGGISDSIRLYDGPTLNEETGIKNTVSLVTSLNNTLIRSSYRNSKELSLMLHNLGKYFVLESNEKIKNNLTKINEYVTEIHENINDEQKIVEFNNFLIQQSEFVF